MARNGPATLSPLVRRFSEKRVLVLGDMVADEYLLGRPERISREAPVLILQFSESFVRPGGATNAAHNIRRLGAAAQVIGVIGDDEMGSTLLRELEAEGIDIRGLVVDPHRPTSTKTRVIGRGSQQVEQQIVRIDRVVTAPVEAAVRDRIIDSVCASMNGLDALLIADYDNGIISTELIDACLPEARRCGVTIVVDSHVDLQRFRGVTAATPNQPEAETAVGRALPSEEDLDAAGVELLRTMDARGVLITRGREGIALYERDRPPYKLPVALDTRSSVVDPTGAGDTVAAVFTLAIASGATMRQGAFLGNVAGGEVVRHFGTAALTPSQLDAAVQASHFPPPP